MARSIRIEYPAYYHLMARGNRRQHIFRDEDDRRFFLQALGEVCGRTGWRVRAWVLMSNHYHLVVETPEANLWLRSGSTLNGAKLRAIVDGVYSVETLIGRGSAGIAVREDRREQHRGECEIEARPASRTRSCLDSHASE